jgi:hypothetical protein
MNIFLPQKKIYIASRPKKRIITAFAKKPDLTNEGNCKKCGRYYKWKVQKLEQHEKPDSEEEDRQTRAMQLFLEYKHGSDSQLSGIGHCCAEREHRIFIRDNVGAVVYE